MKSFAIVSKLGLNGRFILWFLFISLAPLLITIFFTLSRTEKTFEEEVFQEISSVSYVIDGSVSEILNSQKKQLEALARNDAFHSEKFTDDKKVEIQSNLRNTIKGFTEYYEVFVLDNDGTIIFSTNESNIGISKIDDQYFVNPKQSGETFIKDIYLSSSTGQIGYSISTPIIDDSTKTTYGVLVARVKLDRINEYLLSVSETIGNTSSFFIINSNGEYISTPRFMNDSVLLSKVYQTEGMKECVSGQESVKIGEDSNKNETLDSYRSEMIRKSTGLNWCIVGQIRMSEVDAPITDLRKIMYLGVLIIVLLIIVISLYAARSTGNFIKNPIKEAADLLGKTSLALSASTQQAASSSQQNASIAQQVASGATQQSNQASNVVEIMTQMSASIQQMGASVTTVTQSSRNAAAAAQEAGESGEASKKSLGKMRDVIATSSTMVKEVANKSKSISEIVKTITEIAEQTNLLSLNASIEAARAGEAGRGFAVVATEVKDLSEEAKKSANEIGKIVTDMLSNIDETVVATEESNRTVDESSQVITETLVKLQNITKSMFSISESIQELSAVIQQQTSAVEGVNSSLSEVSELAQQSASGAQQLSASVQQQSAINQQVAAASQQLLSLSKDLQNLVGDSTEVTKTKNISKDVVKPLINHEVIHTQKTVEEPDKKVEIRKIA